MARNKGGIQYAVYISIILPLWMESKALFTKSRKVSKASSLLRITPSIIRRRAKIFATVERFLCNWFDCTWVKVNKWDLFQGNCVVRTSFQTSGWELFWTWTTGWACCLQSGPFGRTYALLHQAHSFSTLPGKFHLGLPSSLAWGSIWLPLTLPSRRGHHQWQRSWVRLWSPIHHQSPKEDLPAGFWSWWTMTFNTQISGVSVFNCLASYLSFTDLIDYYPCLTIPLDYKCQIFLS